MCGITGFNWKDESLGEKMNSLILHRGPDAGGLFADEGVTLGNRRLAVIDLSSSANQPMSTISGRYTIVYNGEIYNFKELRSELGEGNFKTESDTEVILLGFEKWGKDVVKRLNGIFVFAIWDKDKRELFCARDHLGIKPFCYFWNGEKFIFASEVQAILAHDVPRRLNLEAFNRYMRVLYSPEPETLIQNIYKLPPGSTLTLSDKNLKIDRYYEPEINISKLSYKDAVSKVREVVSEACERQLVSDVPVGIYLSGGIDSSAVLASVSKVKKNVKTFSVGFKLDEGEESDKFNRDAELARETAKHFGAEHYELLITAEDVARELIPAIESMDEPISNPTAIPMRLLSKFAKKHVTVVLSGNGGDELFGGYERYRMSRRVDVVGKIPFIKYLLPKRIRKALGMSALERLAQFEFEKDFRLERVISKEVFKPISEIKKFFAKYIDNSLDKTDALMLADIKSWLSDQALLLGDKMSMQGSVEERVPLLDREVLDLALTLPLKFKVTPFATKKILKDAFRGMLPEFLFKEPKRGWFAPGAKWIRRPEVEAIFREVLSENYYGPTSNLFDWKAVGEMLDGHISKKEYNLTILWAILTFQIWASKNRIVL